ncbi:HPr family phosphocarrier protein [Spiractinospora alimapuensis]|uniref:HPr family phosphocarrier protein n=1 Tax=Spiractinospora alimapuensis TaxID=2820884 RepID=UPI001F1FD17B|nr:HPr family phosphocarrier protein [Spiractinospora alimapuensis]QVQ50028.1 HPr family phosphocarrier protein [Spiractinospora alimapuensis]
MAEATATIRSEVGLHARPATLFVTAVTETGLPVTIAKDGDAPVDATSLLQVMGLGARHGEKVTLTAEGTDADAVLARLVELLESDLDAH